MISRKSRTSALVTSILIASQVGCLGQMATTGLVREFNLSVVEGKWAREAVFLILYILPVYEIAGSIDLLIVNSIEFHSGTNPITDKPRIALLDGHEEQLAPDGSRASSRMNEDGSVTIDAVDRTGERHSFRLVPTPGAIEVRDGDQNVIYGRVDVGQARAASFAALPGRPRG